MKLEEIKKPADKCRKARNCRNFKNQGDIIRTIYLDLKHEKRRIEINPRRR